MRVGRRAVAISHPDKRLFADPPVTKAQLADYYVAVAPAMLPHLRDRPLALQAFPGGVAGQGFYLKAVPRHFPDWVRTATVPKRGGTITHVLARDAATLALLVGQNVVTPHVWLSRADRPRQPDRLILDLDPAPGIAFAEVRAAAREAGARLRDAGLAAYAMLTGSRGVHVVSPLRRGPDYPAAHAFLRSLAEAMVADAPTRLTLEWRRAERGQRIYLDTGRVAYAQHGIAPYGVRPAAGAPVAMPLRWEELAERSLRADRWTVATAGARLAGEGDAWRGIGRHARSLPPPPGGGGPAR